MSVARRLCMLLLVVFFTVMAGGAAFSMENKFLSGVLTKIDYRAKQIQIDILSRGCRGRRTFAVAGDMSKMKLVVGRKISFYIDSEDCPAPSEVRTIIPFPGGQ